VTTGASEAIPNGRNDVFKRTGTVLAVLAGVGLFIFQLKLAYVQGQNVAELKALRERVDKLSQDMIEVLKRTEWMGKKSG
jgi:hypothetical protein